MTTTTDFRFAVNVSPKPGILDPQGRAVEGSLGHLGIGGIARAEDALEFLVAGCRAVQVGTATFVNPRAIAEVHDGIAAHLEARGFRTLAELPRYLPRD